MAEKKTAKIEEASEAQEALEVLNDCDCGCEMPCCAMCMDIVPVLRKLKEVRADVTTLDWTPDRVMKIGTDKNKWYPYLSIDKMKGQMGTMFARHGLEIQPRFTDLEFRPAIGNMSQHVTLTLCMTVWDVDTGASMEYIVFGEAGDSGDKAISKAQGYALKSWLSTTFLLSEGFDPDAVDASQELPDVPKVFTRTPIEEVEMRSKVLDAGVKPATAAMPAKPAAKPAAPVKPAAPIASDSTDKKPTPIQMNTMKNITESWDAALKEGKVDEEAYNRMSSRRVAVGTSAQAVDFIEEFSQVE